MSPLICGVAVVAAVLCWPSASSAGSHRLARLGLANQPRRIEPGRAGGPDRPGRPGLAGRPLTRPVGVVGLAVVVVAWIGGLRLALALGVLVAGAVAAHARRHRSGLPAGEVALFADLLAGCLRSGMAPAGALRVAAAGGSPPLLALAEWAAAGLAAGLPPDTVWEGWDSDRALAMVAVVCRRTAGSGAAAAGELQRVARRLRSQRRAALDRAAARASTWLVLPLGLCFLPAFVLLTVVPAIAGLWPRLR